MRVKRYVAPNTREALDKVKSDLGPDALILNTKRLPWFWLPWGPVWRFFGRERVEVVASSHSSFEKTLSESLERQPGEGVQSAAERQSTARTSRAMQDEAEGTPGGVQASRGKEGIPSELSSELAEIKSAIMSLRTERPELLSLPPQYRKLYQKLIAEEVEPEAAAGLVEELHRSRGDGRASDENLEAAMCLLLGGKIPFSGGISVSGRGPFVVALVGPTGVGKTTTIAKLAARFSLIERRKVALITADTYRIAAVEQLRTYGDIIGVPISVVHSPAEMKARVEAYGDMELVLIDTAGRSPRNMLQVAELRAFIEAAAPSETHLVLSASTRTRDLYDTVELFKGVRPGRFIFTKLDETATVGGIVSLLLKTGIPLSYLTTGQGVPEDIEIADPGKLVGLMFRREARAALSASG